MRGQNQQLWGNFKVKASVLRSSSRAETDPMEELRRWECEEPGQAAVEGLGQVRV